MKNLSLILNIVLLIAVAVLYYLHFAGPKSGSASIAGNGDAATGELRIAYINADTVLKYYDYHKSSTKQLEEKAKKMDDDFRNRAMGLQNEFAAYQRNVNSMTLGQVKAAEEDLAKKQQNLQMLKQTLTQQVMEEEAKLNKELYDRVTNFLNTYSEEKGIQLVLKYDPSSDVLQVADALDITKDVIDGLNTKYKQEKTSAKETVPAKK